MGSLAAWERLLWMLSIAATVVLLLKLWKEGLVGRYRWVSAYLGWSVLSAIVLSRIPRRTNRYAEVYFFFEIVFWMLFILTTLELFTSVLRRYRGIATAGRRFISAALGIALSIALLSMFIGADYPPNTPLKGVVVMHLFLFGRVVCLSVLLFLLIMSAGLSWFPVPLPANAVRFLLGYTVVFAARTMGYFGVNLRGFGIAEVVSVMCIAAALLSLTYWVIKLNAAGEKTDIIVAHRWSPEAETRLLEQLSSVNSSLGRSSRESDPRNPNS